MEMVSYRYALQIMLGGIAAEDVRRAAAARGDTGTVSVAREGAARQRLAAVERFYCASLPPEEAAAAAAGGGIAAADVAARGAAGAAGEAAHAVRRAAADRELGEHAEELRGAESDALRCALELRARALGAAQLKRRRLEASCALLEAQLTNLRLRMVAETYSVDAIRALGAVRDSLHRAVAASGTERAAAVATLSEFDCAGMSDIVSAYVAVRAETQDKRVQLRELAN